MDGYLLGSGAAVALRALIPVVGGSNPPSPAIYYYLGHIMQALKSPGCNGAKGGAVKHG